MDINWLRSFLIVTIYLIVNIKSELTPPYFNLAEGRKIYASSTCGVGTDGPELYCKLVGAVGNESERLIQGQVCDYCDPTIPEKHHPPEYAIDGTENWWQSPPLSRGMKYNEVNLTIDFSQEFHVAYLFIRMGNAPRPGLWTLEKSSDYGKTWRPWQHFSDSPADCEIYFGKDSFKPIASDDDVICTTDYSKIVPLEGGEIPIMLLNNRPSANNYFNSPVLQEWTRATNVRIRLLRTKTLLGHLMSVARQDPSVTRRYFYSIKDISIGGRCVCNGHASTCHVLDELSANRLLTCQCQHNTCGIQCSECCPGFEQKKWRQNTKARPFKCEPCNCFGHSNRCVYSDEIDEKRLSIDMNGNYEGGGICLDCQHNTEGINCNKCKPKFYRPFGRPWNVTNVCESCNCEHFYSTGNCEEGTGRCECRPEFQEPLCDKCSYGHFGYPKCRPCECFLNGTHGYHCEAVNGKCPCKANFGGNYCKTCALGFYDFPNCTKCECNPTGTIEGSECNALTGQCACKSNYAGKNCDECKNGYFNYPLCAYANCDIHGTVEQICDKISGKCLCKEGYGGINCDQCIPGYYNYPDCVPCNCSLSGSVTTTCDAVGKCQCLSNFAGRQCTLCSAGNYKYPDCLPCNCDLYGSNGISCNNEGQCSCLSNFDSKLCDVCKEGFYNFPFCEDCNCDPAGVVAKFAGCGSVPAGELCQCKDRVQGRICNECKPLYWNLTISNKEGCEDCNCFIDGTVGSLDTCNNQNGQCHCKPSVEGRICSECKDGSFDLYGRSLFGCKDCGCDIGGAVHRVCNKESGQCKCHPRVSGRICNHPITTHYFPTLYQFQFEYEDGFNPSGGVVRYHYDEGVFPGFSKKGYAVFSPLQNEIFNEVEIIKSSVYRMVIRYVNRNEDNVVGNILITSENPNEVDQTAKVSFAPSNEPTFVTVSGPKGPSAIVLDPGRYTISIKAEKSLLFLDYFVLLPAAYYEAAILTRQIESPCEIGNLELCRHFKYPSIKAFQPATQAFIPDGKTQIPVISYYTEIQHLPIIEEDFLPLLSDLQPRLQYNLNVTKPGSYIVVVDYVSDLTNPEDYFIQASLVTEGVPVPDSGDGFITLYPCIYTTVCRQPVVDKESREKVFILNSTKLNTIELVGDSVNRVAIKSVAVIPYDEWSLDYIQPNSVCVIKDGECVKGSFRVVPGAKRIEFETDHDNLITKNLPGHIFDNSTKLILLNRANSTIQIHSNDVPPGRYNILIKYFQPNHPKFNILFKIETDAGKPANDGKIYVKNCPSNIGCRQLVLLNNKQPWLDIDNNFTLTIMNPSDNDLWVDFVLLVPTDQYNDDLLIEETFDQTKEFIEKCGQNHFHISLNASDFCRRAVFSLTSDYNNGALLCNCDYAGSTSFECDPFGGQCQCRLNVIGRRCDSCRTGFYGFPDCKPCHCPSTALCEKETGECICPPQVTGEKCDRCMPHTFGFDQITGCEQCNCNPLGVVRGNIQCNLTTGACQCYDNVVGRSCDKCEYGYYQFPDCRRCNCDIRGTTNEICDQEDETCFCKKNVYGRSCDHCVDGTYNLQASNPEGCTKCFCFGKTNYCESAFLRPFNVSLMTNITINTIEITPKEVRINRWPKDYYTKANETSAEVDLKLQENDHSPVYWGVREFLLDQNNHLAAYGGYLTYSIYYTTGLFGKAIISPDVILTGPNNLTFVHQSHEQPANEQIFHGTVHMVESSFSTLSGASVSRESFMVLLRDLEQIYVRANYWQQTIISRISHIQMTIADEDDEHYALYQELAVEKCQCPPGYTGLSCEDCASGYYRDPNGPYGGSCVQCQCNGHAETCNCRTGICETCQHHTTGDHCEQCVEGYHGNATYGSPYDCMICACPLPIDSNNFATGCEISEDGYKIHCICKEGYTGAKCQSCAAGYYGTPETPGQTCKRCDCSGNIDPSEPGSCDTVTGECLMCLNNTVGKACNLCAPGYYGDAIRLKDCQSCICDDLGTEHCDSFVGTCHCHTNVTGEKCDRCEVDSYGFDSGLGCKSCDCGIASNSTQCDAHSGDCRCKPGVTGRQCNRCLPGYWNYTSTGCVPCSCNTDYSRGLGCNALTGQCECLPGVVGEKCDSCPYRWVLLPDRGCQECDVCVHALLDVTDGFRSQLDPVIQDFNTIAGGYFTSQKLTYFSDRVAHLSPQVKILSPDNITLTPLNQEIESLEMDIKNYNRKVSYSKQNAIELSAAGDKLLNDANIVADKCRVVSSTVNSTIREVKKLAESLSKSESISIIESGLNEGQNILKNLENYKINGNETDVLSRRAKENKFNVTKEVIPVYQVELQLSELKKNIGNFSDKLEDLHDWVLDVNSNTSSALKIHAKNIESPVFSKFNTLTNQKKEIDENIKNATDAFKRAKQLIDQPLAEKFRVIAIQTGRLKEKSDEADAYFPDLELELRKLIDANIAAGKHAEELNNSAGELDRQISNITANSEQALKAATAYSDIASKVQTARKTIGESEYAVGNATVISQGTKERSREAKDAAGILIIQARDTLWHIQNDLQPNLTSSVGALKRVRDTNSYADDLNTAINHALDSINKFDGTTVWQEALPKAELAINRSKEIADIIEPIKSKIRNDSIRAQALPKHADTTNKNILQIQSQIDTVVNTNNPALQKLIEAGETKNNQLAPRVSRLQGQIDKLEKQIEMARALANSINVGVTFYPNTTLELKPPEHIHDLEHTSKVSAYFKTDQPHGFIFYIGNENKTGPNDKFMAMELENGYPVLTVDLGGETEKIIGNQIVSNGEWHQAVVERKGNKIKLIIREELAEGREQVHEVEHALQDPNAGGFDWHKNYTRLFVGGYPPDFNGQESIKYSSFVGQIEDFKIGDEEVGLWNFIDGQDNTQGALARNKLITKDEPTTGYRFSGNGYVIMSAQPYVFKQRSSVAFKFKANRGTTDGLLFYTGKNEQFISVEMRNGEIWYTYRLGEHKVELGVREALNDDKWHKVEAERSGRSGQLKIDGSLVYEDETPDGSEDKFKKPELMYFGGHPDTPEHKEVMSKNFEGCIDEVFITGTPVDLSQNSKAFGIRPGCPQRFSPLISFPTGQFAYVRRPDIVIKNFLQFYFKFSTRQASGVLLYIMNNNQSTTVGLAIDRGEIVLTYMKETLTTYPIRYDDGNWHEVSGGHDGKKIWLEVDKSEYTSENTVPPLNIIQGSAYFGGVPKYFNVPRGAIITTAYLTGCIRDVKINKEAVNFANATDLQSAILDNCKIADNAFLLPVYYPNSTVVEPTFNKTDQNEVDLSNRFDKQDISTITTTTTTTIAPTIKNTTIFSIVNTTSRPVTTTPQSIVNTTIKPIVIVTERPVLKVTTITPIVNVTEVKEPKVTTDIPIDPVEGGVIPVPPPVKVKPVRKPGECALPVEPEMGDIDIGYRFGTSSYSHNQYQKVPLRVRRQYDVVLEFRTEVPDGIIFYMANQQVPRAQGDYIIVHLENGKLVHSYKIAGITTPLSTDKTYNDGKWHKLQFARGRDFATLIVDDENVVFNGLKEAPRLMDVQSPMHIGGATEKLLTELRSGNIISEPIGFIGCLRNIIMYNKPISEPTLTDVIPCNDEVEPGFFFGKNGGYIKLREKFKVGIDMSITLDIKPRTENALLLAVHGRKAYLILQLVNGAVNFTVDNGNGPIVALFKPEVGDSFCDGDWHSVTIIKSKYVLSIQVDGIQSHPGIGSAASTSTDTTRPLYLGGHQYLSKVRGIEARQPYKGCIRNVKIQDKVEHINPSMIVGQIYAGVCPLN